MKTHRISFLALLLLSLAAAARCAAADQVLFDFSQTAELTKMVATDAKVSQSGGALHITTGHAQTYPGVALHAPKGSWDLTPYAQLELRVKNAGDARATLNCRVDNTGADGTNHCVSGSVTLNPGQTDTLKVALKRTADDTMAGKLFGMRGYPVNRGVKGCIDPAQVKQFLIYTNRPTADRSFEITEIRATGTYVPPTAWINDADPFFPFVDTFGQYKHKDWPDKTHSLAELAQRRRQEAQDLAAHPGPADWDKFGGWAAGPTLKATGFFRPEKYQGKWWLVDPDGRLFFSQGVDCVGEINNTPIDRRETWFEDFPGAQPAFKDFLKKSYALKGAYQGTSMTCFAFSSVNLVRKYGPEWAAPYADVVHTRLRSWGLNTIANWSSAEIYGKRRTPYTDNLGSRGAKMIEGSEGYWGKFPDVFDPSFAAGMHRSMQSKRGSSAGDPWCLGYFSDNEMSWGDETAHAMAALKSPAGQAAKQVFIADLKAKYGEIAKFNQAWGEQYASWDALLQGQKTPDRVKAREDLRAFTRKVAETYFRTVNEAIKAVAPHQLYLGCRFAGTNDIAAAAAAKYCDVVSYNIYSRGVANFKFGGGANVPLIIGEFHFGALDRGMFHTGLVSTASQAARAQAYQDYIRGALGHPQFVGCHWFKFQDEPLTGRVYDEENYQIGFVDVADTPYTEIVAACRAVAADLYPIRMGAK